MSDALLLVVRRPFVEQIAKGEKTADLRLDTVDPNTRYVLMYDPDAKGIVGGFVAERVLRKAKSTLWRYVEHRGIPKARFDNYFRSRPQGTAILIGKVELFQPPVSLKEIRELQPDFFVPVSFASLSPESPVLRLAAARGPLLREVLTGHSQASLASYLRDDYRLRPIKPHELKDFRALVQDVVGGAYDDIDTSFTDIIERANEAGSDPYGYFTLTKRIWVAADAETDSAFGYIVTTEKRGGSVKYGPTIIKPDYQGKGVAAKIRRQLDDIYARRGFRKGYSTIPAGHANALKYLFKSGYRVEAHLCRHYRDSRDELVLGRVLLPTRGNPTVQSPLPEPVKYDIQRLPPTHAELVGIVQECLSPSYDGLDEAFCLSVIEAHARYTPSSPFGTKAKQVFTLRENGFLSAVLIGTPKRGGSVKLTPIASRVGPKALAKLILAAEDFFYAEGNRKTYALVPVVDMNLCAALTQCHYSPEGILREPYKPGIDMIVYSRFRGTANG